MIDNENDFTNFKFSNGMSIWPIVRYEVLNISSTSAGKIRSKKNDLTLRNIIKSILKIKLYRGGIQIITSSLFNTINDGGYKNILDEPYLKLSNGLNGHLYESSSSLKHYNKNVEVSSFFEIIDVLYLIFKKISYKFLAKLNSQEVEFIDALIDQGTFDRRQLERVVIEAKCKVKFYEKAYKAYAVLLKPKAVLLNCASYGGKYAIMNYILKCRSIHTVEVQHGIMDGHAYNFKSSDFNVLLSYLPDELFLFGSWWEKQLKSNPVTKTVMGYSHVINYPKVDKELKNDNTFLFISRPDITEELIGHVLDMINLRPECEITFRTHPNEVLTSKQYTTLSEKSISVESSEENLYDSFNKNKFVVGYYSNVFFEALAFDINAVVFENKMLYRTGLNEFVNVIKSVDELTSVEFIDKNKSKLDHLWNDSFSKNYEKWQDDLGYRLNF